MLLLLLQASASHMPLPWPALPRGLPWPAPAASPPLHPACLPVCSPPCSAHPGPNGHTALAELLIGPLVRAMQEVAAGVQPAARQDERVRRLPRPMIPHSPESVSASCLILVRLGSSLQCCALVPLRHQQQRGQQHNRAKHSSTSKPQDSSWQTLHAVSLTRPPPWCTCLPALPPHLPARLQEEFWSVVKRSSGFEYRAEVPQAPTFVQQKWGWSGVTPGERAGGRAGGHVPCGGCGCGQLRLPAGLGARPRSRGTEEAALEAPNKVAVARCQPPSHAPARLRAYLPACRCLGGVRSGHSLA